MPGALLGPFGRYELGFETVTIGRSSTNTVVVNDSQVSSRHLQIIPQGASYLLVDVGSSNGTVYNGTPLRPQTPQPLQNGDVIVVGNTRLSVELAPGAFPSATQAVMPGPPTFMQSEQMGFAPAPFAPNFGPPAQQGAPPPNPFAPYPGNPPGQMPGYYPPGAYGPPGAYQSAPPPARKRRRGVWLVSAIIAIVVIVGGAGLAVFLLSHGAPPGPSIPNATTQVVTPFYDFMEKQNYTEATKLFTQDYLNQHGGQQQFISVVFQPIDQIRGNVTAYHIVSVKPVNGSSTNEVAMVNVTRDSAKGTFDPDMLQLVYQKGKWQISLWQPGQRQNQV
jgi:hypothetical protein